MYLYIGGGDKPPYKLGATRRSISDRWHLYFSFQYDTPKKLGLPQLCPENFKLQRAWSTPHAMYFEEWIKRRNEHLRMSYVGLAKNGKTRQYLTERFDLPLSEVERLVVEEFSHQAALATPAPVDPSSFALNAGKKRSGARLNGPVARGAPVR